MQCLRELRKQYGCRIHSFVLMSNHYHLLISTPRSNIGEAMKYLHREVARKVNRAAGRTNHFFGGRYKWSLIDDENYYWNAVKYVFRNPLRAGLCEKVEAYPYSSLSRPRDLEWMMCDFFRSPDEEIELNLEWLNEKFEAEKEIAIRKALRRRNFELPKTSERTIFSLGLLPTVRKGDAGLYKKGTVTL